MAPSFTRDDFDTLMRGVWTLLIVAALGIIWLFASDYDDWVRAKRWAAVEDGVLYRSAQLPPTRLEEKLVDADIKRIIRLSGDKPNDDWQQIENLVAGRRGIDLVVMNMAGNGTGDPAVYVEAMKILADSEADGEAVWVHCATGSQRTGAVAFLWQVLTMDVSVEDALDDLLWYNHRPHRNTALRPYLRRYIPRIAAELRAAGVEVRDVPESELAALPAECDECADLPELAAEDIPEYSEDCLGCDLWPTQPQVADVR